MCWLAFLKWYGGMNWRVKAHLSHSSFQWSLLYRCRCSYSPGLHKHLHSNMAWMHIRWYLESKTQDSWQRREQFVSVRKAILRAAWFWLYQYLKFMQVYGFIDQVSSINSNLVSCRNKGSRYTKASGLVSRVLPNWTWISSITFTVGSPIC